MAEIHFFLSMVPPTTTNQMKRHNHKTGRTYKGAAVEAAEASVTVLLLPHKPASPLVSPVEIEILARWPWRSGDSKKVRTLGEIPMTAKPDADNFAKGIIDLLKTYRFIEDDAGVSDLIVKKRRGDDPGIGIVVTEVNP